MSDVVYFAYGSNMSRRRLQARVPSAQVLGMGVLAGHALAFHKFSERDGSGKCDIVASVNETVYGVLFRIPAAELPVLDAHEGNGHGYDRRVITLQNESGCAVEAWVYVATQIDPHTRAYRWYKHHVLEGAREAGLPAAYLQHIEAVATVADPDTDRASRELAIYA